MVQEVNVNGVIHEFPDEATPDMMSEALGLNSIAPKTFAEKYQDFWNSQKPNPNDIKDQDVVETMFGRMNKNQPEFNPGSPENKELIDNIISHAGIGSPGLKSIGDIFNNNLPEPILATIGKHLKNTVVNAFKNVEPYQTAAEKVGQEAEQAQINATIPKPGLYTNPQTELENVEGQIGKYINAEANHRKRAASAIVNRINDIEKYWSDSYKKFEDKIKDNEFHMPENVSTTPELDMDAIRAKMQQGANPRKLILDEETKNPFYEHLISKAPTSEDTSAKDFLSKYRDFRDTMGGLKEDLKSERYGSIEKEKISDAIAKGSQMEDQIKDILTQGLGEHKPEFDWLMKGYSEQIFPLRRNPVVNKAKAGTLSKNIIDELQTNQSGMPLLREVVKQDPELLRNVVGQRYMTNPTELHAPNELMREYLDEMPELKDLLERRENTLQNAVKQKNISLKNKVEAENKLHEIQQAKSKAKTKLWLGGIGGSTALGVPYGYGKVSKMLSD